MPVRAGTVSAAMMMYTAVGGRPMPMMMAATMVRKRARMGLLPAICIRRLENLTPSPVAETTPTMMPAQAQAAAEALLENGVELDGYLAWAAKQNVLLDTQAQEILDRLAEQQAQVNSAPEQNGPVLGGMSL